MNHIRETGTLPPEAHDYILEAKLKEARLILGEGNVYDHEQVKAVFGTNLDLKDLPPLEFSESDLEKARKEKMILVLRISHDQEGNPLTPKRMHELLAPRLTSEGHGNIFLPNMGWDYQSEKFFTDETPVAPSPMSSHPLPSEGEDISPPLRGGARGGWTPRAEWKLVTREVVEGSTSKNYIAQTKLIRDKLKDNGWLTPEESDECSDALLDSLQKLLDDDFRKNWKQVAETLANLKITQNHRRSFASALYDTMLVFLASEEHPDRLLEKKRDWTQSRSSDGSLVSLGVFGAGGARVLGWLPGGAGGVLGACFSR